MNKEKSIQEKRCVMKRSLRSVPCSEGSKGSCPVLSNQPTPLGLGRVPEESMWGSGVTSLYTTQRCLSAEHLSLLPATARVHYLLFLN